MRRVIIMVIPIVICVVAFTSCGFNKKNLTVDLSPYYGVWANADCELLQAEKYTLFFERNNGKISAILRQNERSGNTIYSKFFIGFSFDMTTKEYQKIIPSKDNEKIPIDDFFYLKDGQLNLLKATQAKKLQLIEKFEICQPYEMPFADSTTIGKCLHNWQIGVFEHNMNPENLHIEIGTNKHSYIFYITPNMQYCRANRIKHNNNGSFAAAANIRLMLNSGEKTVFMENNNLKISTIDIEINNSLFKPDECGYERDGFYWSVISFTPNEIKINGCGAEYTYVRPNINDEKVVEWFAYESY